MTWKTDKKGRLYKEVEIDADRGTDEFNEKIYEAMEKAAKELMEAQDELENRRKI